MVATVGQFGNQASGTITATTTGAVAVSFGFQAVAFQVVAATSGGCFVDLTGGQTVLATTSASYPLAPNEKVTWPLAGTVRQPAGNIGFSILGTTGATSTVRFLAMR